MCAPAATGQAEARARNVDDMLVTSFSMLEYGRHIKGGIGERILFADMFCFVCIFLTI